MHILWDITDKNVGWSNIGPTSGRQYWHCANLHCCIGYQLWFYFMNSCDLFLCFHFQIRKQPLLTPKEEVVSPPPSITSYIQDWGRTRPTKRPLVSEPNIQPHSSSLSTGIGVTRSPSIEMGPRVHPKVVLPRRRENTSTSLFPGESPAKGSWQPDNSKSLVPARWHGNQSASTSLFPKESAAKGSWQSDNSTSLVPARWHGNQSTATPSSPSNITVNISCNSFTMSSFAAQARTANMGNFPLAVDTRLFSDAGRGYREQSDAQPPLAIEPKPIPRPAPQMPVQPVVQQTVQPVAQQNAPNEFRRYVQNIWMV